MSKIKVSENSSGQNFELLEAGSYVARCFQMIHIGTNTENILGKDKELNKVRISWELPTELKVFKEENGEQPHVVSKEFTLSLNEKANLRKFLESWRGKQFEEKELKDFDISVLIGATCQLNLIHNQAKNGNTYLEIASVSKLMKGLVCPDAINKTLCFGYDPFEPELLELVPEFILEKIKSSKEYREVTSNIDAPKGKAKSTPQAAAVENEEEEEDDLLF